MSCLVERWGVAISRVGTLLLTYPPPWRLLVESPANTTPTALAESVCSRHEMFKA